MSLKSPRGQWVNDWSSLKKFKKFTPSDSRRLSDEPQKKVKRGKNSKRLVQPIPLDSSGRPIFPIELGHLTVHSLGEVSF